MREPARRQWLAWGFIVLVAGGCSAPAEEASGAQLVLAANQLVIGERVTFQGANGEPVTPLPGVYRVAAERDRLHLFFGKSRKPLVLKATKKNLKLTEEQKGVLQAPRAMLSFDEQSPVRRLRLFLPDGAAYTSSGALEGRRMRGIVMDSDPDLDPDPVYATMPATIGIAAPTPRQLYWNRLKPLDVVWTSDAAGTCLVHLVQRVTQRTMATTAGTGTAQLGGLYHLDPGFYDVVVTHQGTGGSATQMIRVLGRIRSIDVADHVIAIGPDTSKGMAQDYVWAWGTNSYGQAGPGGLKKLMSESLGAWRAGAVSAGNSHSLFLTRSGAVFAFGRNIFGQIGGGESSDRPVPKELGAPLDRGVIAIAAGAMSSIALKRDGTVWACGWNHYGQCGQGPGSTATEAYTSPVQVKQISGPAANPSLTELTGVVAIAAGASHVLALKEDGTLWGWGLNSHGQLDTTVGVHSNCPHAIPLWKDWVASVKIRAIDAVQSNSVALVEGSDGKLRVFAWGENRDGVYVPGGEFLEAPTMIYEPGAAFVIAPCPRNFIYSNQKTNLIVQRGPAPYIDRMLPPGETSVGDLEWSTAHFTLVSSKVNLIAAHGHPHACIALAWEWGPVSQPVVLTWGESNRYSLLGADVHDLNGGHFMLRFN